MYIIQTAFKNGIPQDYIINTIYEYPEPKIDFKVNEINKLRKDLTQMGNYTMVRHNGFNDELWDQNGKKLFSTSRIKGFVDNKFVVDDDKKGECYYSATGQFVDLTPKQKEINRKAEEERQRKLREQRIEKVGKAMKIQVLKSYFYRKSYNEPALDYRDLNTVREAISTIEKHPDDDPSYASSLVTLRERAAAISQVLEAERPEFVRLHQNYRSQRISERDEYARQAAQYEKFVKAEKENELSGVQYYIERDDWSQGRFIDSDDDYNDHSDVKYKFPEQSTTKEFEVHKVNYKGDIHYYSDEHKSKILNEVISVTLHKYWIEYIEEKLSKLEYKAKYHYIPDYIAE